MSEIIFLRSNKISDELNNGTGLIDLLKAHLNSFSVNEEEQARVFEEITIVVPTQAFAIWLRDRLTHASGVCANIDFVVLLGPILNKIYRWNNKDQQIADFEDATAQIYKYLCTTKISTSDAKDINNYLYKEDILDKKRAYIIASQLQKIFHEYLYIRTDEILNLEKSSIPQYQQEILRYLLNQESAKKTFLDVYQYFINLDFKRNKPILPSQLFIFGLTSAYASQLQIIKKLAEKITIYWYYKTCSFDYYGDLLSNNVKRKLEQKCFKNPDLHLEDLYLNDGNPILSNLGQQSREFIELLNLHDIAVYDFKGGEVKNGTALKTFLGVLQEDILNLTYRIDKNKRLAENNDYYQDPVRLTNSMNGQIYDLAGNDTSIKVNVCHNKMREVQVMFNEIAHLLDNGVAYDDILITAPDIDDYAVYINAIFANEYVENTNGNKYKILCNVTGSRHYSDLAVLEIYNLFINAPYQLAVNYFLEILMVDVLQQALDISLDDVELIKTWLHDNKTYFGFDADDYTGYGYENYAVHSFKQFLSNIVLGACLSDTRSWSSINLSLQKSRLTTIIPYDNIDSQQISLCNKLIQLISLLEFVRGEFYISENNYRELSIGQIHTILSRIQDELFRGEDNLLISQKFLGKFLQLESLLTKDVTINLPIFNIIFNDYREDFQKNINLNGMITAASMQYVRNISYNYVYVLGLNLGAYPRVYEPSMLSVLSKSWYLADRNYTNEDKQTFLDIFLSTGKKIFFSYIGRSETDNSVIEPSPILAQILETLGESFLDFRRIDYKMDHCISNDDMMMAHDGYIDKIDPSVRVDEMLGGAAASATYRTNYRNLIEIHALHPFYKNTTQNYSKFWAEISAQIDNEHKNILSGFTLQEYLNKEQLQTIMSEVSIDKISNTFIYTNANIYKALGIRTFKDDEELIDIESFSLEDRGLAKELYRYLENMSDGDNNQLGGAEVTELYEYLVANGTLGYKYLGQAQFTSYYTLYQVYQKHHGKKTKISVEIPWGELVLKVKDEIYLEENNIIVIDKFENITKSDLEKTVNDLKYEVKIKAMVLNAIIAKSTELANHNIYIRDITINGDYQDYLVKLSDTNCLNWVFKYYIESYKKPTLIHKQAIKKYVSTKLEGQKDAYLEAKKIYANDYQNYELERIREDYIFSNIAENYFEFMQEQKLLNDVMIVGELLSQTNIFKTSIV